LAVDTEVKSHFLGNFKTKAEGVRAAGSPTISRATPGGSEEKRGGVLKKDVGILDDWSPGGGGSKDTEEGTLRAQWESPWHTGRVECI